MAIQKVQEFKELTIYYSSNGPSILQMYTDIPAGTIDIAEGTLAIRLPAGAPSSAGYTIPSSNNVRSTFTFPLDNIEGTEFYFKFTPGATTQLRLYAGSVKMRMIGIHLDGSLTVPEFWATTPVALGV